MLIFDIKVTTKKSHWFNGLQAHEGVIKLGDFSEGFMMPLNSWHLSDYLNQWKDAANRILTHNSSHFVVLVQNLQTDPLIVTWQLYKERDIIFVQNSMYNNTIINDLNWSIALEKFSPSNCYELIDKETHITHINGEKILEWTIHVDDITAWLESKKSHEKI